MQHFYDIPWFSFHNAHDSRSFLETSNRKKVFMLKRELESSDIGSRRRWFDHGERQARNLFASQLEVVLYDNDGTDVVVFFLFLVDRDSSGKSCDKSAL